MRGFLLSLDSIVAISLLLIMVIFLTNTVFTFSTSQPLYHRMYTVGSDMMNLMEESKMGNFRDFSVVQELLVNKTLIEDDMNKTLLDVIGSLWASGNLTEARSLVKGIFDPFASQFKYEIKFGNDVIYSSDSGKREIVAKLSTIASGFDVGKVVSGYISRTFITLLSKTSSEYVYFGGFVGEGNLSQTMTLPDFDTILNVTMEMNVVNNFTLYINGNNSGLYIVQNFTNLSATRWTIPSSNYNYFKNGSNVLEFNFTSNENAFISGGFFKVTYNTTDLLASSLLPPGEAVHQYRFPGINGIVNLFTSFYIPGNVTNMTAVLHYTSIYPVHMIIGNTTIIDSNATSEQNITLNDSFFSSLLSYSSLGKRTIPMRFGVRGLELFGLGNVDSVLITDRTGSMTACDVDIDCSTPGICDSNPTGGCHQRRSLVALEADKIFVDVITNSNEKNEIGLIGYGEITKPVCSFLDFDNNNASFQARLDRYNYNNNWQTCGWTCISCGIYSAVRLVTEKRLLHNFKVIEAVNSSPFHVGNSGKVAITEFFNLSLDPAKFLKARLTFLGTNIDVVDGYKDCVFVNDNFLGRVCTGTSASRAGWHTCEYPLNPGILKDGINNVTITGATVVGCFDTSDEQDDWDFIDVKLRVWESDYTDPNISVATIPGQVNLNAPQRIQYLSYAHLWEPAQDEPNPVDFTTGLNSSANTFGLEGQEDGWDWLGGNYSFDNDVDFNGAVGGKLDMDMRTSPGDDNNCNNYDCSGAYGITVNITPEIYSNISQGIFVSFIYEWNGNDDPFEASDQVWIKGRWTSPSSGAHWLGSSLDSGHSGQDGDPEIATEDDPDTDFTGIFYQNITSWIESSGLYYLDLGGKLRASASNEWGTFRFDDVAVGVYNATLPATNYWNNLSVMLSNINDTKAALLSIEMDDIDPTYYNCLYMNGKFLGRVDQQKWSANQSWETAVFDVPIIHLNEGNNTIRVTGGSQDGCERSGGDMFSFRNITMTLHQTNESYNYTSMMSILVMSDGEANTKIGDCRNYGSSSCSTVSGTPTPSEEAIDEACDAFNTYGISVYSVAFGDVGPTARQTMEDIATCDDPSHFYTSNNAEELINIYRTIARDMINISFIRQGTNVSSTVVFNSTLFRNSFINFTYTHNISPLKFGEVVLTAESKTLGEYSGNATITDNVTGTKDGVYFVPNNDSDVIDAKVTSYSSDFWTDRLYASSDGINYTNVYWLGNYSSDYVTMGDPYTVNIPVELIVTGKNNYIKLGTGSSPGNATGASLDSKIIYTLRLSGINLDGYSGIFPKAKGSTVTVYYDNDADDDYDGFTEISYGLDPSDIFDPNNDSVDDAFMRLLDGLNIVFDKNLGSYGTGSVGDPYDGVNMTNPIDLKIASDVSFDSSSVFGIPTLWGPAKIGISVWT